MHNAFWLTCLSALCYLVVPSSYWFDWDTLMYAINVRVNMAGDLSFSYMHNLLKDLLFNTYQLCQSANEECQITDSVRFLTLASTIVSTSMIFLAIKKLTDDTVISVTGSIFWLILPGNILLVHLNEDNVWAASYTCIFIFAAVNIHKACEKGWAALCIWVVVAAGSLSAGINIHQQLGLLFYLFFVLILGHYRITVPKKLISLLLFCAWYVLISIVLNTAAFGHAHLQESITRLYHNPYASIFPELWYFTSGLTLSDWCSLILAGWRKTLFFNGRNVPALFYLLLVLLLYFSYIGVRNSLRRSPDASISDALKQQLWLSLSFLIFIPYSLLYEPQNIERWDSTLPGLTVVVFSTASIALHHFSRKFRNPGLAVSAGTICLTVFLSLTSVQSFVFISKMRSTHENDSTTVNLRKILTKLEGVDRIDTTVLLLSDGFRKWDTDSQILLFYPSVRFITLQRGNLRPIHSSHPLQHTDFNMNIPLSDQAFPKGSTFIATPSIYNDIKTIIPQFLDKNTVTVLDFK
jgi:hypothetical protein